MTSLPVRAATAVAIACIAAAAAPLTPASADASSNGCPRGYELFSVAALPGYLVPGIVDDPTSGVRSFGRPGNGDGLVCGVPLGNQTWINGQIYNFWDNTLHS
jgi:hypothetical protein